MKFFFFFFLIPKIDYKRNVSIQTGINFNLWLVYNELYSTYFPYGEQEKSQDSCISLRGQKFESTEELWLVWDPFKKKSNAGEKKTTKKGEF